MLGTLGMNVPKDNGKNQNLKAIDLKNVAIVMVTADLPPFTRSGDSMDVMAHPWETPPAWTEACCSCRCCGPPTVRCTPRAGPNPMLPPTNIPIPGTIGRAPKPHSNIGVMTRAAWPSRDVPMEQPSRLDAVTWVLNRPDFDTPRPRSPASINGRFGSGTAVARDVIHRGRLFFRSDRGGVGGGPGGPDGRPASAQRSPDGPGCPGWPQRQRRDRRKPRLSSGHATYHDWQLDVSGTFPRDGRRSCQQPATPGPVAKMMAVLRMLRRSAPCCPLKWTSSEKGEQIMSTTTGAFQIGGIISGLDTNNIITGDQVASGPLNALQAQQTSISNQESAYTSLNTNLTALQAATKPLTQAATYQQVPRPVRTPRIFGVHLYGSDGRNLSVDGLATGATGSIAVAGIFPIPTHSAGYRDPEHSGGTGHLRPHYGQQRQ